jgi:S1-C subfamily serine protease
VSKQLVERLSNNVVRVDVKVEGEWGNGSGLILDNQTILTCDHVVRPNMTTPQSISVVKGSQLPKPSEITKFDDHHDLALITNKDLAHVCSISEASYEEVEVGAECFILGYPTGLSHLTLTKGMVSAKGKGLVKQFPFEMIQVDARVNHGNSGGPVFLNTGSLIGNVSLKYIPFLDKIKELNEKVKDLPVAPHQVHIGTDYIDVDIGGFYNRINDSLKTLCNALLDVQVGIGWVIPISTLDTTTMKSFKQK